MPVAAKAGMIKAADLILDLGRGLEEDAKRQRGVRGGEVDASGTPEEVVRKPWSFNRQYLAPLLTS